MGQTHVVRTLRNAVRQNRVAHAYLFTGPRGTGKTSTARILAKALNCTAPNDGNPCDRCENCVAANEGRALDVIEIDAASNTSVENVRDLRERVGYAASEGRYKVYIIDEVHRLSGAAFDAFLKTLEEPPPHVIFVFASTEPHKVPGTIMSRCQRFDFKRLSLQETTTHLHHVATEERIEISNEALTLLGRSAAGSMRDAIALLDQVASYATGAIGGADVRAALGLADPMLVARLADHLLSNQVGLGLQECAGFVGAGGDPSQLITEMVNYWRAVLTSVTGAGSIEDLVDPALVENIEHARENVTEQQAVSVLEAITGVELSSKYDLPPQLPLELGYVRASLALRSDKDHNGGSGSGPRATVATAPRGQADQAAVPEVQERVAEYRPQGVADTSARPANSASPGAAEMLSETVARAPSTSENDRTVLLQNLVAAMRPKSASLQAVLRSGFLLSVEDGEVTIGFQFPFHANVWTDVGKRRLLEECVAEVMGSTYRVQCIRTTKDEAKAALGASVLPEDDGFIEEAAERLRQWHARQLGNGSS